MRTDVGTFMVKIPPLSDAAKVTIELNSEQRMVFHLFHHLPDGQAAVQLSGLLLEVEFEAESQASKTLLSGLWQAKKDGIETRWKRDKRCMGCSQNRERFSPACNECDEAIRKDRRLLTVAKPVLEGRKP